MPWNSTNARPAKMTADKVAAALRLRAAGWSWSQLALHFRVADMTVRRAIDPQMRERLNARDRELRHERVRRARERDESVARAAHDTREFARPRVDPAALAERDRRMSVVPTLDQRFFGDPLPGRSALDQKRAQEDRR
jgi:hypothetical protein